MSCSLIDVKSMSLKSVLDYFLHDLECKSAKSYEDEFRALKDFSESLSGLAEFSTSIGDLDENRKKNRYKDILPFNATRVILNDNDDYVNASYIKGASGSNAYIATQGPLPHTLIDFWRLVVQSEVQVIVMACNEMEAGKHKCERYWTHDYVTADEQSPKPRTFGPFSVTLMKCREICPDFLVRTLRLRWTKKKKKKRSRKDELEDGEEEDEDEDQEDETEERTVCQFHYSAWPDHGIPAQVKPLLEMVRLIRDCQSSETLPVLVHCSAGCGRTGTICAIDFIWGLLRTGKLTRDFSLFNLVKDMRRQRFAMVQTLDQYILVHRAVKELFLEQLRVIDSHPYENVNAEGLPLLQDDDDDEITPDYETVFVKDDIDAILSEKISQKTFNLQHDNDDNRLSEEEEEEEIAEEMKPTPPPKKRDLESLNLESRISIGTSASAAASTVNSSDNLLEDFHRDISKSTPKLFDPPESSPGRIKKGNLRLCQTDDGLWKLDDNVGNKPLNTINNNNVTPGIFNNNVKEDEFRRRQSMKKIKAFFSSNTKSPDEVTASAIS